jgi:hypothetical protein
MENLSTYFLYFLFACLGAAVGALIQRAQDRRSAPPAPPPIPPDSPPDTQTSSPTENTLASEGDVEILRAWRTLSGKMWLEMDGTRLNGKESLLPDKRRRLVSLLVELRPWLENTPPAATSPSAQPSPVIIPPVTPPAPPVKSGKKEAKEAKPAQVLRSMVEQIDDILQVKLSTSPLKDRDIHLVEGTGGMVYVTDGLTRYEGIDTVPDPQVQAIIRQAVTEWDKAPHPSSSPAR